MLKRVLFCVLMTGLIIDLTGCSALKKSNFAKKRRTEYLRSRETAPLQVPAGLDASGVSDDYIVPASNAPAPVRSIGLLPPDSLADKLARGVVTKQAVTNAKAIADAKSPAVVPAVAATSSTTAIAAQPSGVATLSAGNALPLNKTIAQAWQPVGAGIKRAGYRIAVQDEKTATYYILDTHSTDERVTKATPIYQIKLDSSANGNAFAYVTDQNGKMVDAATSQRILTDLSNGLAGKGPSSSFFAPVTKWFKEAF